MTYEEVYKEMATCLAALNIADDLAYGAADEKDREVALSVKTLIRERLDELKTAALNMKKDLE